MGEPMPAARARRPIWRRPGLLILLVLLGWAAWAGYELVRAGLDGTAGMRLAKSGERAASEGDITGPAALRDLREGNRRLEGASRHLDAPPVVALRVLPVVGRNVRELHALSVGAAQLAEVSADTLEAAQRALEAERATPAQRVELLRAVAAVADDGAKRTEAIRLTPGRDLAAPIRRQHAELGRQVERARSTMGRGAAGANAMAALLDGPRRYVVLASNNAEMRAGSGMFNSVGGLTTAGGKLTLEPFTPASDIRVPAPGAPVTGDLAARWGWLEPGREWRNLGVSPRFDVTAPLAASMWERLGRGRPDGVLAVDPVFLAAVLEGVGPVDVDGLRLDSSNVVDRILHDQYVDHAEDPPDQQARREELGRIAQAVLGALESRTWDPVTLGRAVARAAQGRHVLAWSSRPEEQRGWEAAGIDGSLQGDSLLLSVLNRGGNKLDQYLAIDASLDVVRGEAKTEGVLEVRLRNGVPTGVPQYIAGPDPNSGVGEGDYLGYLTVNLPGFAAQARIDGVDRLVVAGADGPTRVVGAEIRLARGEERTYVVRFDLPAGPGSLEVEPAARVPAPEWSTDGSPDRTDRPGRVVW